MKYEKVVLDKTAGSDSNTSYYLIYNHLDGQTKVYIDSFSIDHRVLEKLLKTYRNRNNQKDLINNTNKKSP